MDRKKLETAVESQTFKFISMIKESASDAVMQWANRNAFPVDNVLLQKILDQYKAALETEYLAKVDFFLLKNLDKDFQEFAGQENPLPLSDIKSTPKKKTTSKK